VDTGLARGTLVSVVKTLASLDLVRIEKDGQRHIYHVLMPVQNRTDRSKSEPVELSTSGSNLNRSVSESDRSTGSKVNRHRFKSMHPTGSNLNRHLNLKENLKENLKGAQAREPESEGLSSEEKAKQAKQAKQAAAPPPAPPPKAPTTGTTESSAVRPDDPFDDGGETKPWMGNLLGRTVHLAARPPDAVTDDDRPRTEADRLRMAEQMAGLVADLQRSLRAKSYPPRSAVLDRQEQIDACERIPRVTPRFLSGAQLAAARRIAGIQPACRPDA
jgi:hypothetical protein